MFIGILIFILGMFFATQNTQSKIAWPMIVVGLVLIAVPAHGHDPAHHEHNEWYSELRQPDNPNLSCCGEKDAYWCDDYFAKDGKAYCRITDDRVIEGRPPVPVGTVIAIPDHKLKYDRGNPTGHSIVFGTRVYGDEFYVYCFVQAGGV